MGYAGENGYVVDSLEELDALPQFDRAIIVAQTTQNKLFFDDVKKWAAKKSPHYKIFDTICDSTARRQSEVQRLADAVDAIIVVGGHNSGNTKRAETRGRNGKTQGRRYGNRGLGDRVGLLAHGRNGLGKAR